MARTSRGSTSSVQWLGLQAVYTEDERALMAELSIREQTFVHALKALTKGEIGEGGVEQPGTLGTTVKPTGLGNAETPSPTVYTNHEDIPFGEPARLKPSERVVLLRWTWNKGRILNTKRAAHHKMKVWRRWYERQGWTVKGYGESMIARSPSGERHSITLRVHAKKGAVAGPPLNDSGLTCASQHGR